MKTFVLISAVCLQIGCIYGTGTNYGGGAYSYQDSSGRRYEGTYGLKDGQVVDAKGTFPPDFSPPDFLNTDFSGPDFTPPEFSSTFNDLDDNSRFFPDYFRNLENLLQEAFQSNIENQNLAMNAARKAFDLTSNQARYNNVHSFDHGWGGFQGPQFPNQFPFHGHSMNPSFNDNSAYAAGAVGPGFKQQTAYINPSNPNMPNINKKSRSGSGGGYQSVSVSSSSSSSNVNGQKTSRRTATSMVNDNGKVSTYTVHSP